MSLHVQCCQTTKVLRSSTFPMVQRCSFKTSIFITYSSRQTLKITNTKSTVGSLQYPTRIRQQISYGYEHGNSLTALECNWKVANCILKDTLQVHAFMSKWWLSTWIPVSNNSSNKLLMFLTMSFSRTWVTWQT